MGRRGVELRPAPYSRIEHLARGRWLGRNLKQCWMVMLTCYFDGSGDKDSTNVYSVAGYVSTVDRWIDFDKKWSALLKRHGLPYFHMKEFAPSVDHFKEWKGKEKERKRGAFLEQLVNITRKHVLHSFSVTLRMDLYDAANKFYPLKEKRVVPLLLCGGGCIAKALYWRRNKGRAEEPIMFYFERDEKNWGILKQWANDHGYPCESGPKLPDPSKPLDFPLTPLQAADFVAWEQRKLYDDVVIQGKDRIRYSLKGLTTIPHQWDAFETRDFTRFAIANKMEPRKEWLDKMKGTK